MKPLTVVAIVLLAIGISFWCVGLVSSNLGHLSAGNIWYTVSAAFSLASAAIMVIMRLKKGLWKSPG